MFSTFFSWKQWFITRFLNLQSRCQFPWKSDASRRLRWQNRHCSSRNNNNNNINNRWVRSQGEIQMWRNLSGWDRKLLRDRGFNKLKSLSPHWNSTLFARRLSAPTLAGSLSLSLCYFRFSHIFLLFNYLGYPYSVQFWMLLVGFPVLVLVFCMYCSNWVVKLLHF